MARGYAGKGRLRPGSMSPSASSLRASSATCWRRRPSPASERENTSKFMRPFGAYSVKRPVSSTSCPTRSAMPAALKRLFHIMHGSAARSSFTVKYTAL